MRPHWFVICSCKVWWSVEILGTNVHGASKMFALQVCCWQWQKVGLEAVCRQVEFSMLRLTSYSHFSIWVVWCTINHSSMNTHRGSSLSYWKIILKTMYGFPDFCIIVIVNSINSMCVRVCTCVDTCMLGSRIVKQRKQCEKLKVINMWIWWLLHKSNRNPCSHKEVFP